MVLIDICNVNGDEDAIDETLTIRRSDRQIAVRALRFIVKSCAGLQLPCVFVNTKRVLIVSLKRIG